jgi:glutathione S-transferase
VGKAPRVAMIFYSSRISAPGAKVAIVIAAKGIEAGRREPPGGAGSDAYQKLVPSGVVPALVDGTFVLNDSEVIAEYLEEAFPEPTLLPGDAKARAQIRYYARFHDLYIEPSVRALLRQLDPRIQDMDVILPAAEHLHQCLAEMDAHSKPHPYLAAKSLSLADCGFPITLMQADIALDALGMKPKATRKLANWRDTLEAHPAVESVMKIWRPATIAWLEKTLNISG